MESGCLPPIVRVAAKPVAVTVPYWLFGGERGSGTSEFATRGLVRLLLHSDSGTGLDICSYLRSTHEQVRLHRRLGAAEDVAELATESRKSDLAYPVQTRKP